MPYVVILLLWSNLVYGDMLLVKEADGSQHLVKTRHLSTNSKITHEDIRRRVKVASLKHRVDEKLILAIIRAESNYNPNAVSSKGAIGLMQLMRSTGKWLNVKDINDYRQNIDGGVRYIKILITLFKDIRLAVAAYNAGPGAVITSGYRVPAYAGTQNYVKTVMKYYND